VQTEGRKPSLLEFYAEVQPILCKDSANRTQCIKFTWMHCWGAAYLMQR